MRWFLLALVLASCAQARCPYYEDYCKEVLV